MTTRTSHRLPPAPPATVLQEMRGRLSGQEMRVLEALFALRTTAQHVDNAVTERVAGTAGSPARYQILMLLWAAKGRGVPHKDIVAALGVTRPTVSGLIAALEREGLVSSSVDRDDRRKLLAALTPKGETLMDEGFDANLAQVHTMFASLSPEELTTLTALLQRVRESVVAGANAADR